MRFFLIFLDFDRCRRDGLPISLVSQKVKAAGSGVSGRLKTGGETCFGDVSQLAILAFRW